MKKRDLIIIALIIVAVLAVLSLRFFKIGDNSDCRSFLSGEDCWLCQNGEWIKHGNPNAPAPTEQCGGFEAKTETMAVKIYFNNSKLDPEYSCNKVFPVEREILKTSAVAKAGLEELLKGPTENEKAGGFFTSINNGVKIQKLTIENGIAKVDFDEQLEFQAGGSCRVSAIRSQIIQTLKQFQSVNEVIISINGRTEDILQP